MVGWDFLHSEKTVGLDIMPLSTAGCLHFTLLALVRVKWHFDSFSHTNESGGKTRFWPASDVIDNNPLPDIIFESLPTMIPDEHVNKNGLYIMFLTSRQVIILVHLQTFSPYSCYFGDI